MCECRSKDKELDAEKKDYALVLGAWDTKDWVREGAKEHYSKKGLVGDLHKDIGDNESSPVICLRRPFTDLVQVTLENELWHDLLHESSKDGGDHEYGKDEGL